MSPVSGSFTSDPKRVIPGQTAKLTLVCKSPVEETDPVIAVMVRKADGLSLENNQVEMEESGERMERRELPGESPNVNVNVNVNVHILVPQKTLVPGSTEMR